MAELFLLNCVLTFILLLEDIQGPERSLPKGLCQLLGQDPESKPLTSRISLLSVLHNPARVPCYHHSPVSEHLLCPNAMLAADLHCFVLSLQGPTASRLLL